MKQRELIERYLRRERKTKCIRKKHGERRERGILEERNGMCVCICVYIKCV